MSPRHRREAKSTGRCRGDQCDCLRWEADRCRATLKGQSANDVGAACGVPASVCSIQGDGTCIDVVDRAVDHSELQRRRSTEGGRYAAQLQTDLLAGVDADLWRNDEANFQDVSSRGAHHARTDLQHGRKRAVVALCCHEEWRVQGSKQCHGNRQGRKSIGCMEELHGVRLSVARPITPGQEQATHDRIKAHA